MRSLNEYFYCFQPKICPRDLTVFGYEALLRKKHKTTISTPLDAIREIDFNPDFALKLLSLLKKQISKIDLDSSVVISINTPPYLIEEHCDVLLAELMKHSNTIELEILETSSIIDFDKYNMNIRQLKSELSNLRVTLDDYGKGFASLERLLKGESIDGVKIDRELFLELAKNNHKVGFYEKWLGFIKMFDVDITIEGVENEQEYEMAVCLGADYIQGYYTGRPRCLI